MTFELWCLLLACLMGLVHVGASSFTFKAQVGNTYSVGPRDEGISPEQMAGRMARAQSNFLETFPIFAACVLIVFVTDSAGALSYWGSLLYLVGRVIYLPLYASGLPWVRTVCWQFATTGVLLVGVQAVL